MSDGTGLKLVTFEGTSARDVLAKLHREIDRIEGGVEHDHIRDHVVNAFWTGWHFHGWLWDVIKDQPELKDAVIRYRGLDGEALDSKLSFGSALAERFVPLRICRMIAMSPRHVRVTVAGPPIDPQFPTIDGSAYAVDEEGDPSIISTPPGAVAVIVMGRPVAVTRLLKEVEDYWVTLIHECGIELLR